MGHCNTKIRDLEEYLEILNDAYNRPPSKRTILQRRLLDLSKNSPSYNSLFGKDEVKHV